MARTSFGRSPGPKKSVSFKYASKFVGSRIDIVSEKILTLVKKNPKAVSYLHLLFLYIRKIFNYNYVYILDGKMDA